MQRTKASNVSRIDQMESDDRAYWHTDYGKDHNWSELVDRRLADDIPFRKEQQHGNEQND